MRKRARLGGLIQAGRRGRRQQKTRRALRCAGLRTAAYYTVL